LRVDPPERAVEAPAVAFQAAEQDAHEAEAGLVEGAHAGEAHHL
jgi:hypothetical protein